MADAPEAPGSSGPGPAAPSGLIDLGWTLLIGAIGLALRLVYARQFASHPMGRVPWVDEGAYWTRAQIILHGRWLPDVPFYQDPLFAYALAILMRAAGTAEVAGLRPVLAGLGSLTPVAVLWAGRLGLGRAEGILAGLAMACYGPLIFTDALIEKEGLAAMVAALALVLSARAVVPARGVRTSASAGAAWGALSLLRGNALLIAPLGAVCLARDAGRWRGPRGLGFLAGFAAAVAPATLTNLAVSRPTELILTTWQAGANFYIGNGPEATGVYAAPDFVEANPAREALDFAAEARRRSGRWLSPGEVSRFWWGQGLRRWREAPGSSLRLLARKAFLLAQDSEIPDNQDIEVVRIVAAPALAGGFLSFGWLAPWAALGLASPSRGPFWRLLAATTLVGLTSTAAFFVVGRYRIPWAPGLALLAAAGAVDAIRRARRGRWRSLAWRIAFLGAPTATLAWWPNPDPAPNRWGHARIGLALAELSAGRIDPALDWLDEARALGPGPSLRVFELLARGPVHDLVVLLAARRPGPDPDDTRGDDGLLLVRRLRQVPEGRAEARRLLDERLRERPDDRPALRESGAWWLGRPDDPSARNRAEAELRLASRGPGGDDPAKLLLALSVRDPRLLPACDGRPGRPDPTRIKLAAASLR